VKPFLVYTAARAGLLVAVALLLYAIGLRGFPLAVFALIVSLPLSYLVLARQRVALGVHLERRMAERRARSAALRTQLRGDEPATQPADQPDRPAEPAEPAG
jgi:hypothetical protein